MKEKANLRMLTHLIDARLNLRQAKAQSKGADTHDIECTLLQVEVLISEHVGDDWEEL